ncbi:DNA fragmentation factor subunit beta [Orussus abietinus]|uniref:DNA fragmentation factor subunit beta n=1 Tax=Orussus abietinus TaxID=222816 RepID=UPI000626E92C|nr:DNA fragmentation factor subunit beta [Orussus abietinus]
MFIFRGSRKDPEESKTDQPKGFKVTDVNRTRKFGIACRGLQELKRKACVKFSLSTDDLTNVEIFLLDGSLVDEEYFRTLEPQTTLVLLRPGEKVMSDADLLYETLKRVNMDFLMAGEAVSKFLTKNLKTKVAVLNSAVNKNDSKTGFSSRNDHPEWFQGLETNAMTKEAYMHRRCQDRIRGYLYKTIEQIRTSEVYLNNSQARMNLLNTISFFKMQLKEDHYFGFYFDRSCAKPQESNSKDETDFQERNCYDHCPCMLKNLDAHIYGTFIQDESCGQDETDARKMSSREKSQMERIPLICPYRVTSSDPKNRIALCDKNGEFRCSGVWNAEKCPYGERHRINPYRSREDLILFSTWNLDHKTERSRTLIPHILKIAEQDSISEKDVVELYEDLFTVKNLRLVHIICHDKGAHN